MAVTSTQQAAKQQEALQKRAADAKRTPAEQKAAEQERIPEPQPESKMDMRPKTETEREKTEEEVPPAPQPVPPTEREKGTRDDPGPRPGARLANGTLVASEANTKNEAKAVLGPDADRRGAWTTWQTETQAEVKLDEQGNPSSLPVRLEGGTATQGPLAPQSEEQSSRPSDRRPKADGPQEGDEVELPSTSTFGGAFNARWQAMIDEIKDTYGDDQETVQQVLARRLAVAEMFVAKQIRERGGFARINANDALQSSGLNFDIPTDISPGMDEILIRAF